MIKLLPVLAATGLTLLLQTPTRAAGCIDMKPGVNRLEVTSDGKPQRVDLLMPPSFDPRKGVPLVIGLHPSGGSGATFDEYAGLGAAATAKGFAALFPDGGVQMPTANGAAGHYWNIPGVPLVNGGAAPEGTRDDVRFIADVIDHVVKNSCIDAGRIYVTGFSGGARMTSMLGCRLADRIAAVAPVAGLRAGRAAGSAFNEPDETDCRPRRPLPVLAIHGTDDETNPFPGGGGLRWGYSVERAAARWARLDGCDAAPAIEKASSHVARIRYAACGAGSEVVLYRIEAPRDQGGGHVWPGGRVASSGGESPSRLDATAVILEFFGRH